MIGLCNRPEGKVEASPENDAISFLRADFKDCKGSGAMMELD
jgi:hypothetical protein